MLAGPFSSSESAPATVLEWSLSFLMIMARFSQEVPSFLVGVASVKSRDTRRTSGTSANCSRNSPPCACSRSRSESFRNRRDCPGHFYSMLVNRVGRGLRKNGILVYGVFDSRDEEAHPAAPPKV
jgi:hypothetical protein